MKFSKIACATVFALSSQAAIIHHAPEFNMKGMLSQLVKVIQPLAQNLNLLLHLKESTLILPKKFLSIITALLGNIPQIIQIIMGIVKAFQR